MSAMEWKAFMDSVERTYQRLRKQAIYAMVCEMMG